MSPRTISGAGTYLPRKFAYLSSTPANGNEQVENLPFTSRQHAKWPQSQGPVPDAGPVVRAGSNVMVGISRSTA